MSLNRLPTQFSAMAVTTFGGPDSLALVTLPIPQLESGQVLIKMSATSINPIDYKTRAGLGWAAAQNKDNLPFVLGYDCYGAVAQLGQQVTEFSLGDKVVGLVGFPLQAGTYGEYVVAQAKDLVIVSLDQHHQLCALPVCGLTAQQGLFEHGELTTGQTVLISGAGGSVGYLAVQLALAAGASVVAVAHPRDHHRLSQLGALTLIDYNKLDSFSNIGDIDLWFDLIGGEVAISQLEKVAVIKRLVTVPTITAPAVCESVADKGTKACQMLVSPDINNLTKLVNMVENETLKLNIVKQVDFKQAAIAHHQLESGEIKGKIALIF